MLELDFILLSESVHMTPGLRRACSAAGRSPALQSHIAAQHPAVLQLDAFRCTLQVSRQAGCGGRTRAPLIGQRAAAQRGDGRVLLVWGRSRRKGRRGLLTGQMVT